MVHIASLAYANTKIAKAKTYVVTKSEEEASVPYE